MRKENVVKVIIGRVKPDVKISCHAELVSASSTHVVSQRQQQRQAWKTYNQTPYYNLTGRGQVVNAAVWGESTNFNVGLTPDLYANLRCNPYRSGVNPTSNKGFTLIELLVVVLIIGILAAVALPQYQKAVAKARTAQLYTRLNAVEKAVQVYYLANGSFPMDVRDLDLGIETGDAQFAHLDRLTGSAEAQGLVYQNGDQCGTTNYGAGDMIFCGNQDIHFMYRYDPYPNLIGQLCTAATPEGEKICYSLSPRKRITGTYENGLHQYALYGYD